MRVTINNAEYDLPPLTAPTMRKMHKLIGIPMAEMRPAQIMAALVAMAADIPIDEAVEVLHRQLAENNGEALAATTDAITAEVNRRIRWTPKRNKKVRREWVNAFEGR